MIRYTLFASRSQISAYSVLVEIQDSRNMSTGVDSTSEGSKLGMSNLDYPEMNMNIKAYKKYSQ